MLTNLNWLNQGEVFPPVTEKKRIEQYNMNEMLFLSQHDEAWGEKFREIAFKFKKKNYDVKTVFNYQQLLSKKTADFVCGEPPVIETENDTDELDRMLEKQKFNIKLYEGVIDISRFGNGIIKFVGKNITAVSPKSWFPVVDYTDVKTIKQHVIAYPINPDSKGVMRELFVEIHDIGKIEQRIYPLNDKKEIGKLKESKVYETNLEDFAIQTLTNITHSSSVYGVDDYAIINSIVAKIMWRLHCADTIRDKHSEPSMSGSSSILSYDDRTGLYYVDLGNFFRRDSNDEPDFKYITWDGSLENNFKEIETLFDQLYILSEMGQAFLEGGGGGNATSGTALKLKMVSPRIKAQRIANINADTVKTIIHLLAKVNGISIDYDTLTIKWQDGLPKDEVEEVNTLTTATGGKPIMSQYSALKQRGLTDSEVEAELEQLRKEQASNSPLNLGIVDSLTEEE